MVDTPNPTNTFTGQATGDQAQMGILLQLLQPISTYFKTQSTVASPNTIFAGPSSGSAASPTFRFIAQSDLTPIRGQYIGTNTNDSAAAGNIGEYVFSNIAVGSAVNLSTATPANVASISLGSGDWTIWGSIGLSPASSTLSTVNSGWISTTSATVPTVPNGGVYFLDGNSHGAGVAYVYPCGTARLSLASIATVYLSVESTFVSSTMAAYGFIGARRAR